MDGAEGGGVGSAVGIGSARAEERCCLCGWEWMSGQNSLSVISFNKKLPANDQ